jgi:hypothetical protein
MARATYAKPTGTLAVHATKLALFKTLFADTLESGGVIKTGDSGQINWGTVNLALDNASPVTYGYEIREFTDTLAATFPIRIKTTFKNDINGNGDAKITIGAGTGSDGAGSLTGQFMADTDFMIKNDSSIRNCYVCCDEGNLIAMCYNNRSDASTGTPMVGSIERTRDQNGDPTSDGLLVFNKPYSVQSSIGAVARGMYTYRRGVGLVGTGGGDTASSNNRGGTSAPPDNISTGIQLTGNEISVYRAPFYDGPKILHPMKAFVSVFANDYTFEGTHTLTIDSDPQEYVGLQKLPYLCRSSHPSTMGLMMRYST